MNRTKLAALLGAGLLTFGVVGIALAGTGPSDPGGVSPVEHSGNIQLPGSNNDGDKADCDAADAVAIDGQGGNTDFTDDATTTNGVKVTVTYDKDTKTLSFTADGGLVTIAYVKGGDAYNEYDYGAGIAADGNLYAPNNGGDQPAGLSHVVFCTGASEESSAPTEQPSQNQGEDTNQPTQPSTDALGTSGQSGPSDSAWLLVVALGVLLASVVVLTPARSKTRR